MFIYLKRLISSKFVRVKAFPMYGGIGVSAPSLHRESTDSLIGTQPTLTNKPALVMHIYGDIHLYTHTCWHIYSREIEFPQTR